MPDSFPIESNPSPLECEIIGTREVKMLKFIEAYLDTANATEAARQLGYKDGTASNMGWRFLNDPFVQDRLTAHFTAHRKSKKIVRREIISGLYREANDYSQGGNAITRVRAWETLAKLHGLDREEVNDSQEIRCAPLSREEVRLVREEFELKY